MEIETYKWWGETGEPPPHLKTKKQLAEMGLKPVKAVGIIPTRKYDVLLYDPANPESCKPKRQPTQKQLEALEISRAKARYKSAYKEWYEEVGFIEKDRVKAVKWARKQLGLDDWVVLDTETTGFNEAEIVEIAIVQPSGEPLLNTLIKPTIPIPLEVTQIHNITDEMVAQAPTFPEIYPAIVEALTDKQVFIYNSTFDIKVLNYCCNLHGLPIINLRYSECIMEWVAQWIGNWSYYYKNYKWQPLNGEHRALGDCLAVLKKIKKMAADSDTIDCPIINPFP
ncbi:3'-5' exonuclease [Kamptonema sp. UHCC 0994]|uniref:3'-5' exonuclease n=1 Tax=Kamptonema sp. UHCC 0994 TaxID=3031329 RepID=UPI0023BAA736|nr:3'-5' exonuclease [Kamptonema sp. UHCC 0994]MDF0556375.1 3'-5' exonuclease [Kamptonema sp. UHCC 0994]